MLFVIRLSLSIIKGFLSVKEAHVAGKLGQICIKASSTSFVMDINEEKQPTLVSIKYYSQISFA